MLLDDKKNELPLFTKEFHMLGTIIRLAVYGQKGEKALIEAYVKLAEIDDKMSVFKADSEISKINYNSGYIPQKLDSDTFSVINTAVGYGDLSKGALEPTIRPIIDLWGICTDHACIPNKNDIDKKLELVNYKDIILDEDKNTVMLKKENQALDLGCIAKGYAADEVIKILVRNQIESAIIDLGGNIFALGSKSEGVPWNIGIQDPTRCRGECIGSIIVSNKSVVTSGNYVRYFVSNGRNFHHIIDPRTGYPVNNGITSVTIVSDNSIDGDALSTCAFVMGLRSGIDFIETFDGMEAIFITENKDIFITPGIKDNFQLLSKEFVIQTM